MKWLLSLMMSIGLISSASAQINQLPNAIVPLTGNEFVALDQPQGTSFATVKALLSTVLNININTLIDLSSSTVHPAFIYAPGSMDLTGYGWWLPGWWGNRGGQRVHMLFGSPTAPITTAGSPVAIGIVQGKTAVTCDNNSANTGCNSALLVQNMGTAATTMTTNGVTSYAETLSTSGLGIANAQAGNFIAVASASAQTGGMGLYSVGMRFGILGSAYGAEISAWNRTDFDCSPASYTTISRCDGIWLAMRGPDAGPTKLVSSALHVGLGNAYGGAREGITFNNASVNEKTINDQSSSDTVFNVGGSHINGFMAEAGTSITGNTFNDLSSSPRSVNIGGTHSEAAIWVRLGAGFFGLNTGVAPTSLFHMGGTISLPAYTNNGAVIQQALGGITDTTSTGVVSTTNVVNIFKGTQLSATNPGVVYNTAATMYLGDPLPGTNVTIDKAYSLITLGDVLVGGNFTAASITSVTGKLVSDTDVVAPRMVFYGDSLTNSKYDRFIVLSKYKTGFTASSGPVEKSFSTQTSGYGGMNASTGLTYAPELLDPLYQSRSPLNIVLIWLGTNDIALGSVTPVDTWTRITNLAASAKKKGFKVCVGTSISRVGNDTNLAALNTLIVAGWSAAGINCLVNFASNANLAPNGTNYTNTTYYSTDQVHLNATGQALAASVAQTELNTYIDSFTGPIPPEFNASGNMTAAGLATAGTITGSLCRTATGLFIYKAGANCF